MSRIAAPVLCGLLTLFARPAGAEPPATCPPLVDERAALQCALARHPDVLRARQEVRAAAARRGTADLLLPNNPNVILNGAHRKALTSGDTALNWTATLSQEVEVAGQRGLRQDVADAERRVAERKQAVVEAEVAGRALAAWHAAVGARDAVRLAEEGSRLATAMAEVVGARAAEGLSAPVEARLAKAEAVHALLALATAERHAADRALELDVALGGDGSGEIAGLERAQLPHLGEAPPPVEEVVALALKRRGDAAAAEAEQAVFVHTAELLRRTRVPNPTVSLGLGNDGFDERVVTLGLAVPIPLPAPLGKTHAAQIAETTERAALAGLDADAARKHVAAEARAAWHEATHLAEARRALGHDVVESARTDLGALREAVESKQLSARDALFSQRSLLEVLQADLDLRIALVLADDELKRATGTALDEVRR